MLSDKRILAAVDTFLSDAEGYYDSTLRTERLQVLDYYNAEKPARTRGKSSYISQDVYSAVEMMKAQLLETFAAGSRIVQFAPVGSEDVDQAKQATDLCEWVVMRQNKGYSVFSDVIHDALLSRLGVAKAWWKKDFEDVEEELPKKGVTIEALVGLPPDITEGKLETDPMTGLTTGSFKRRVDKSRVVIAPVPHEEFLWDPKAKDLATANCAHRQRMTRSDLLKAGYDEKLVKKIPKGDSNVRGWESSTERAARQGLSIAVDPDDMEALQEELEEVYVYECYLDLDINEDGIAETYQIVAAGDVLLSKEQVRARPFLGFIPLRIPHTLAGNNFANRLIPIQNAKTMLFRSVLDHTAITSSPRWQVVNGTIKDPKELMENRLGGLINVSRPDGIIPLPQQPLNPFVFQTIETLQYEREENTGVSRLSQGLNKDAVSKQNSAAMIEQLASIGAIRQKIVARNFSMFLGELYLLVYELLLGNLKDEMAYEITGGQWQRANVEGWQSRKDVSVELHLGYGEQDREAEQWLALDQMFSNDPQIAPLYTLQEKWEVINRFFDLKGIKNATRFLRKPEDAVPVSDQQAQGQLAVEQGKVQNDAAKIQLEREKMQLQAQQETARLELEKMRVTADIAFKKATLALKAQDQAHEVMVDTAEVNIMQQQADSEQASIIVSPNS